MIEARTQRQPSAAPKEKARNASKRHGPSKSLNQSNAMNSKRLTIIRGRFCRHNLRKPSGPVLENIFGIAYATRNDMAGFVAPDFSTDARILGVGLVCCGRGGACPQGWPHGYTRVFNHHAHTLRLKTQRVVPESRIGAKTMHMATQRPSAQHAHRGHITTPAHAGHPCNLVKGGTQ